MIALAAALLLVLMTGEAVASKACPTRQEAREMHGQKAYLYWFYNADRQRCWSNRRTKSESARGRTRSLPRHERVEAKAPTPPPPTPAPAPLPLYLPAELMPQPHVTPKHHQRTILDTPQWAWVEDARAHANHADLPQQEPPNYSTFQRGTEPDVWPALPQPAEPATTSKLMLFITTVLMGFAAGVMFWRWRLNRIRIPTQRSEPWLRMLRRAWPRPTPSTRSWR